MFALLRKSQHCCYEIAKKKHTYKKALLRNDLFPIFLVLQHKTASLEYHAAANDANTGTPTSQEASSSNFTLFGLTQPGIKPAASCLRGGCSNHWATAAVMTKEISLENTDE